MPVTNFFTNEVKLPYTKINKMNKKIKALNDQRGSINEEMKAIIATAEEDSGRALTTEEDAKFDELNLKDLNLEKSIERLKTLDAKEIQEVENVINLAKEAGKSVDNFEDDAKKERAIYRKYLVGDLQSLSSDEKAWIHTRAQTVTTTGGGYLIPTSLANEIVTSLQFSGGMREVSRILPTATGNNLDFPTDDDTGNTGALLAINTAASESDLTFGTLQLNAYKYTTGMIRVPNELLQDSAFDVEAHIKEQFVRRIGRITNLHYTTGSGSSRPQGVTIGATQGKLSASSVTTTFSELLDLKHSVDPSYRLNGSWMFSDATLLILKKLSMTTANQSIWQPGIVGGAPSTIDGQKFTINNDVADMADNTRSVLYGDFNKFIIRDVLGLSIKRSVDRYVAEDQVAFVGFMRTDSGILDSAAIKYMRMIVT